MRADIDRFRKELNIDYIDVVLIHVMRSDDWTTRYLATMEVLSEAEERAGEPGEVLGARLGSPRLRPRVSGPVSERIGRPDRASAPSQRASVVWRESASRTLRTLAKASARRSRRESQTA